MTAPRSTNPSSLLLLQPSHPDICDANCWPQYGLCLVRLHNIIIIVWELWSTPATMMAAAMPPTTPPTMPAVELPPLLGAGVGTGTGGGEAGGGGDASGGGDTGGGLGDAPRLTLLTCRPAGHSSSGCCHRGCKFLTTSRSYRCIVHGPAGICWSLRGFHQIRGNVAQETCLLSGVPGGSCRSQQSSRLPSGQMAESLRGHQRSLGPARHCWPAAACGHLCWLQGRPRMVRQQVQTPDSATETQHHGQR